MWPDRVLNPGPLALESDVLLTALRGPAPAPLSRIDQGLVCSAMNTFHWGISI